METYQVLDKVEDIDSDYVYYFNFNDVWNMPDYDEIQYIMLLIKEMED